MDVIRGNMPEQSSDEIANFRIKDLPCLYVQPENGSRIWHRDPKVSCQRVLMRRRIAHYLSVNTSYGIKQRAFLADRLERDLFKEAASQEYFRPEKLSDRLKSLLERKLNVEAGHGRKVTKIISELQLPLGMETPTSGQLNGHWSSDVGSTIVQDPLHTPPLQTLAHKNSAEADSKNSDDLLPSPKRMRLEISGLGDPMKNQTCFSTSPLSVNAEAIEDRFSESFTKSVQYSMSLREMRYNDAHGSIRKKSKAATVMKEELIFTHEPMDMEPASGNSTGDNVKESSSSVLRVDCEAAEVQIRTESVKNPKAETVPSDELIASHKPMDIEQTRGNNAGDNVKEISDSLHLKSLPELPKVFQVDCEASKVETRTESVQTQPRLESGPENVKRPGCPRSRNVSITEILTTEQLKEHISSLCQPTNQDFLDIESDKNVCQLCRKDPILLAPEPKYCSRCAVPIKCINHKANYYYCTPKQDSQLYFFCTKCYNASKDENISIFGMCIPKDTLYKRRNDSEIEESWVQCDTCEGWQHQICGLFNDKSDSGDSEYKCPLCWLKEKENGEYKPSTSSVVFRAKDLPRTKLGLHIEERLFRRLKQERKERAKTAGKCFDEVPGAEDLTVRVVLSTKKKVTVKKQLLDTLEDESYPAEFPYTSKLILLFQKIGGVDVCLFSMYVQEFGSDCSQPNQRCVYISYIDSVKYFRPAIGTSTGEALRTFAFHEILIGYLDFIKKRGFTTCYIWACPPLEGDDYFFYCHPEIQKIPRPDKLRKWYLSMIRKASNEGIVLNCTNLYDQFFVSTGEANCKITAARLPYFDGDYWTGAVEDAVNNIDKETKEDPNNKKKKPMSKTSLKVMGHTNSSSSATKDILLMQKLGQVILRYKKDFLVVHLQFVCAQCGEPILSGKRWFCNHCKNFHLCERCHAKKPDLYSNETHTSARGEQHFLSQVLMDVTLDIKDEDVILGHELFDNRNSFLTFCQENHYQFDSLRRAKHSSMIMLYHLRHLAVPAVGAGCCQIQKSTQQSSTVNHEARSKVKLQERAKRDLLHLLKHASHCQATKSDPCSYENCHNIRMMFSHAKVCTVRAKGGCKTCEKAWFALILHAENCTEQDCQMPRCKDLKRAATSKC